MMESNLELKGEMRGGFFQALGRRLANGESFFQQSIEAVHGVCTLESPLQETLFSLSLNL